MYLPSKFTALVYCIVLMALAGAGTNSARPVCGLRLRGEPKLQPQPATHSIHSL
jgi:hypothetical protein